MIRAVQWFMQFSDSVVRTVQWLVQFSGSCSIVPGSRSLVVKWFSGSFS